MTESVCPVPAFFSCILDYLELHDGSNLNAELISRLCGNTRPSTQLSTGSSLLLRFRTDTSVTHKGFKAKYSIGKSAVRGPEWQIHPGNQNDSHEHSPVSISATCGGTLVGQNGALSSPGFPGSNYPDSSSCEWYLEGPTGHYLTLTFGNFSLQSSAGCSGDYVEIRDYNASGKKQSTKVR